MPCFVYFSDTVSQTSLEITSYSYAGDDLYAHATLAGDQLYALIWRDDEYFQLQPDPDNSTTVAIKMSEVDYSQKAMWQPHFFQNETFPDVVGGARQLTSLERSFPGDVRSRVMV